MNVYNTISHTYPSICYSFQAENKATNKKRVVCVAGGKAKIAIPTEEELKYLGEKTGVNRDRLISFFKQQRTYKYSFWHHLMRALNLNAEIYLQAPTMGIYDDAVYEGESGAVEQRENLYIACGRKSINLLPLENEISQAFLQQAENHGIIVSLFN